MRWRYFGTDISEVVFLKSHLFSCCLTGREIQTQRDLPSALLLHRVTNSQAKMRPGLEIQSGFHWWVAGTPVPEPLFTASWSGWYFEAGLLIQSQFGLMYAHMECGDPK